MKTARVGDLADQIRGVTYAKGDASDVPLDTHVTLLRAGNIGDSGLLMDDLIFVPKVKVSPRQALQPNDVLIAASSGSLSVVGKAARIVEPINGSFGAFCKVLRPSPSVDPAYFAHFFRTSAYRRYISSVAAGANINNLRGEDLDRIEIPLPPLPEQRRIAAILDEADALRATQLRAVRACTALAEATFRELEGSLDVRRAVPLDDIAIVSSGIAKGRKAPSGPLSSVDYMTVANVQDKRLDLSVVKQIDVSAVELGRYRLQRGDLLLTEGGDPDKLGRGVVWNEERKDAIHQNHVFRVRLRDPALSPVWLSWEIGSAYGKSYFLRMAKQTTGIATINSTQLRAFPVRIPDPGAVERFLASLERVRSVQVDEERRTSFVDSLFASLQHRAFRGEL